MSPKPSSSRLLPVLLIAGLIALGGAVAYAVLQGPPDVVSPAPKEADLGPLSPDSIAFAPVVIDPAAIQTARAALTLGEPPDPALVQPLLARFFELNRMEAAKASEPTRRPVETALGIRLRELIGISGRPGFYAFIEQTRPDFLKALQTLRDAAKAQNTPIDTLINADPPPEDLKAALGWAGGFVLLSRAIGLMDPQGQIPDRLAPITDVLYRYRWYTVLAGSFDPRELLTREEYSLLVRWRLQEARNIPTAQRLQYVHEATLLNPDFPAAAAEGILYAQDHDADAARQRFNAQAELRPDLAPLMLRYNQLLDQPAPPPEEAQKKP